MHLALRVDEIVQSRIADLSDELHCEIEEGLRNGRELSGKNIRGATSRGIGDYKEQIRHQK